MTGTPRVPTLAEIRAALAALEGHPRKRFGQHFLADPRLLDSIAAVADVGPGDRVLEVGPGPGTLTATLLARGARVLAVDVDTTMLALLGRLLHGAEGLEVVEIDVLERGKLRPELVLRLRNFVAGGPFKLVSNLPYNVASPFLIELWKTAPPTVGAVLVQREVGERIAASPGGGEYGVLSVLLQWRAETAVVRRIASGAFWPPPKVESAVVKLVTRTEPIYGQDDPSRAEELLKRAFQQRRKTLVNSLRDSLPAAADARATAISCLVAEFGGNQRRPESVTPMEWVRLARRLRAL